MPPRPQAHPGEGFANNLGGFQPSQAANCHTVNHRYRLDIDIDIDINIHIDIDTSMHVSLKVFGIRFFVL